MNKLWYGLVGFFTFLFKKKTDLAEIVKLKCDGVEVSLPKGTQGLILTNIGSYAGGSVLWPFKHTTNKSSSGISSSSSGGGSDSDTSSSTQSSSEKSDISSRSSVWRPQQSGDGIIEVCVYVYE